MQVRRSRWWFVAAFVIALALGACTPGGGGSPSAQPPASSAPVIDY